MTTVVADGPTRPMPPPTIAVPSSTSAGELSPESNSSGTKPQAAMSRPARRTTRGPWRVTSRPLTTAVAPSIRPNGAITAPDRSADPSSTYCTRWGSRNSIPSVAT